MIEVHVRCDICRRDSGPFLGDDVQSVRNELKAQGWNVGPASGRDRCPNCARIHDRIERLKREGSL